MAKALQDDYPEVKNAVRIGEFGSWMVSYKEKTFIEEHFLFADSTFFKIFDIKVLEGNPNTALVHPRSVMVSEETAKRYFGDEDPMGKLIKVEQDSVYYKVTGIVENSPANSHFQYDMIGSMVSLRNSRDPQWTSHNHYTYILLNDGVDPAEFEPKMRQMVVTYVGEELQKYVGITLEQLVEMGK